MQAYFDQLDRRRFEGPKTANPLAFRHYNPDEIVLGNRMGEYHQKTPSKKPCFPLLAAARNA
ncbi:hypothetical protein QZQ97_16935 [Serratia sp. root2]|jgi:xylose isomerase|uniref:hypothetical protein n=1 Tax=Serratia sp. root2 TaxID=3059676 RepID=UPI00288F4DF8|nr:hypothetical protein [Serratia sp. root2]MDT3252603.1 hypothetical protein [Serratia sp. root2]